MEKQIIKDGTINQSTEYSDLLSEFKKVQETLKELSTNSNLENTEIKKYIDNFSLLKKDIDALLNSKNPISFIFQLKKIKDTFMIHLENLIDYIEKEISLENTQKHKLLHDLGVNLLQDKKEYLLDSRYFFEEMYFETYSKIDSDYKHLVQKLISIQKKADLKEEILKEGKYKKYEGLLNFLERNNIDLSKISINEQKESKFGYEIIKQFLNNQKYNSKDKVKFLSEFYTFFSITGIDFKYSKSVEINNITNFDTINDFKKGQLDQNIINKLDGIIRNYDRSYRFYVDIYEEIKKDDDSRKRGYYWGYTRNEIKKNYSISRLLGSEKKVNEDSWLEMRVNYRVDLRNDSSKEETYKFMDGFNQFRNIILNIQDSIFSDFYKVYILKILSEKLSLKKETYGNFKYFMLYYLPKNYLEYCKIYTFFSELESYKEGKSILKLSIIHYLIFGGISIFVFFKVSWLLGFGLSLIALGTLWKNGNYKTMKTNLFYNIRPHLALDCIGYIIAAFYLVLALSNNGFFEVKIDSIEQLNNKEFVWQKIEAENFQGLKQTAANVQEHNQ